MHCYHSTINFLTQDHNLSAYLNLTINIWPVPIADSLQLATNTPCTAVAAAAPDNMHPE